MATITVHHLENSRSLRILWLLEELGLPYDLVEYPRDPVTMRAPPALARLHPLGKAPVVTVKEGEADPYVLAESGAIIEHFVESEGRLAPPRGTAEHPLLLKLITGNVRTAKVPFLVKPVAKGIADKIDGTFTDPELKRHFDFLDGELSQRPYFAGQEFTAADIQMFYGIDAGLERAGATDRRHVVAWLERVKARDAYKRAVARGGENHPHGA